MPGVIPRALRRGLFSSIVSKHICIEHDINEQFVFKKVLMYLYHLINRYFILDEELVEILYWSLEEEMAPIGEFLFNMLRKGEQTEFRERFEEDGLASRYEHIHVIVELLKKITHTDLMSFKQFLQVTILKRYDSLKYKGKCEIEKNMDALKKLFHLTNQEVKLCTFLFIIDKYSAPQNYFYNHLECHRYSGRKYLKCVIDIKDTTIYDPLNGTLRKSAILDIEQNEIELETDWVSWLEHPSNQIFSKRFYSLLSKSTIPLKQHFVPSETLSHVLNLLKCRGESSSHILLYGPPGSGKTSFARGLAGRLDMPAYEIMRGKENKSTARQAAIRACINMTDRDSAALIVVDEADNLLNTRLSWLMQGETIDKGWLNHLLDEAGARMIWITNRIDEIDPSVLRRFAFSIHFKPFNRRQRYQLWKNALHMHGCPLLKDRKEIEELAGRYHVSAGGIELAVRKAMEGKKCSGKALLKSIQLTLDAHETLLNYGERCEEKGRIDDSYSLDGLTINGNVDQVMAHLEKFDLYLKSGRKDGISSLNLLFYGPPGTGKSELGSYIAQRLDRSVVCRDISEIQSKWLGDSEKNIRAAFEEAEHEDAVLIFDEVDTLLFNREKALRSWEISFTNAFLTRMERFRGILICTTNLVAGLDGASIRRFNHKIGLGYLTGNGNVKFYNRMIAPLIDKALNVEKEEILRRQSVLTPGDFKVVRDNFSFYPREEVTHGSCVQALLEEVRHKEKYLEKAGIGF